MGAPDTKILAAWPGWVWWGLALGVSVWGLWQVPGATGVAYEASVLVDMGTTVRSSELLDGLRRPAVLEYLAAAVGLSMTGEEVLARLRMQAAGETVTIQVRHPDPQHARELAEVVAAQLLEVDAREADAWNEAQDSVERALRAELEVLQTQEAAEDRARALAGLIGRLTEVARERQHRSPQANDAIVRPVSPWPAGARRTLVAVILALAGMVAAGRLWARGLHLAVGRTAR